jgi:tRNA A58 N-methylase Trm61
MISPGSLVIDATAGNGHDTVFLAERVGASGRVLAFDVQQAALLATRSRVTEAGILGRVELILKSHLRMGEHADPGSVAAVMFNLGYLPGQGHELTTEVGETLAALETATGLLQGGGALSVVCYPGHPAGAIEAEAVESWMSQLTAAGWRVARYGAIGTRRPAPFLLLASKPKR